MKFLTKIFILSALLSLSYFDTKAQLSGSYTIPGSYADISSAITALGAGVSGSVTFTVSAAQTTPSGGYLINPITGSSATNTVKFIASGAASVTAVGSVATNDAIFKLLGADNVTIEGFTMSAPNTVEFGIALLNPSASDGVQGCTFKNNTITLDKTNANPTTGIYAAHTNNSGTTVTPTVAAGTHSSNIIIGNTISNVITGIGLGVLGVSTTNWDTNNVIGQSGAGNTITNFANAAVQSYGIRCEGQAGIQVNHNTIDNLSVTGNTGTLDGIYFTNGAAQNIVATNNTIKMTRGLSTSQWAGIRNIGYTGTLNISNNILSNWTMPTGTAVATSVFMITNTAAAASYTIDNNQIKDCITFNSSSTMYVIHNTGGTSGAISCSNNTIDNIKRITAGGSIYAIYNASSATSGGSETISGNTISNIGGNGVVSTASHYAIYTSTNVLQTARTISNNTISNITSGGLWSIYSATGASATINGNTISGITLSAGGFYGVNTTTNAATISNNQIAVTIAGASAPYGIQASGSTSSTTFGNTVTISGTGTGTTYGIYLTTSTTINAYENTISVGAAMTTNSIHGMYIAGGTTANIYKNRVQNVSATTATTGAANGIYLGAATNNCYNNLVSGISAPTSTTGSAVNGINCAGTITNVYNNTIKLTGAAVSGASGVFWNFVNTGNVNTLINNIIIVDMTLTGASPRSMACIRKGPSATGSIGSSTNNNIHYVPISNPDAYIYVEGTTTLVNGFSLNAAPTTGTSIIPQDFNTGCNAYRTFMSPKESASFFENVFMGGTTGLIPTAGLASYAESSAATVAIVTTDYTGATRTAPSDIGAYEFAGILSDATGPSIAFTPLPINTICTNGPTLTATITDPSGVNITTAPPRLWFRKSSNTTTLGATNDNTTDGWKYVNAIGTAPYTFAFDYSLLNGGVPGINDVIHYFVAAQDLSTVPNVGTKQATFATGYCATSVALGTGAFPLIGTAPNTFTISNPGTVNTITNPSDQVCVSGTITFSLSGGFSTGATFQWQDSPNGITWTDIASGTNSTYSKFIDATTTKLYYRCDFRCLGSSVGSSTTRLISVSNPVLTSTAPAARCGTGTVDLQATVASGTINWYDALTGGTPLTSGTTFTTPSISATRDFYATAVSANQSANKIPGDGGWDHITTLGGYVTSIFGTSSMSITVTQATTLFAFDIYPGSIALGSNFTIEARTGTTTGAAVATYSGTTTVQNGGGSIVPTNAQTVPVNWSLAPGIYHIGFTVNPGFWRSGSATHSFPWSYPGYASLNSGLATYQYFFYNFIVGLPCESARVPIKATVNTPPSVTLPASLARCSADAPTALNAVSTNTGYTYSWTPPDGLSATTGASVTSNIGGNIAYTVSATDNSSGTFAGCATTATVDVNVNITPAIPVITTNNTLSTPCINLTTATTKSASTVVIGTGTSASATYSPYKVQFGAAKMQYLYLASELNALGFNPNQIISSIGFDVLSHTGGAYTMKNFTIKMANVSATALATTFLTPTFTTCYSRDYVLNNTSNAFLNHTFSTPFTWNGTDNILVETCYDSNDAGIVSSATVKYTSTTGNLCAYTAGADNAGGTYCGVSTGGTATTVRPNIKFNYGTNTTTWSPTLGLFTDTPLSVPYASGDNATLLYAAPSAATTYMVSATNTGCSSLGTGSQAVPSSDANIILTPTGGQNSTSSCERSSWTYYGDGTNVYFAINWAPDGTISMANSMAKSTATVSLALETTPTTQTGSIQTVKAMKRFWNVLGAGSFDEPVNIKFFYALSEYNEINNDATLVNKTWFKTVAVDYTGLANMSNGAITNAVPLTVSSSGTENSVNYVQFNGIASFSGGTFSGATVSSPLPIKLKALIAFENKTKNTIQWETEIEQNLRHFVVEKSKDGKTWENLKEIIPTQAKRYTSDDQTPFATTYYRLKNVDNDGRSEYSNIVVVERQTGKFNITSVAPNPTSNDLTVKFETIDNVEVAINVLDIFGKVVLTQQVEAVKGINSTVVNTSTLPAGAYFLNVNNGVNTLTQRIVKQ